MTLRCLDLTIPGPPTSKGRPRFSRASGRAFTPAKTRDAEETLTGRALALMLRHPDAAQWPSRTALHVTLVFVLPVPPSWPRWKRDAALEGRLRPVSKPDVDNLSKLAKDALNSVLWVDDSQVVGLTASKVYGEKPSTRVIVAELEHQAERGTA